MSDEKNTASAACEGDCGSCMSDCETVKFDKAHHRISITRDDGVELECEVVNVFQAKDQKYIVLLPLIDMDGGCYLFRFFQEKNEQPRLDNIEDPAEYDFAANVYANLLEQLDNEQKNN